MGKVLKITLKCLLGLLIALVVATLLGIPKKIYSKIKELKD